MHEKIGLLSSKKKEKACLLKDDILKRNSDVVHITSVEQAVAEKINCFLVLGGDGFMLRALHQYMHLNKPFYGINCGNTGFLLNDNAELADIKNTISRAKSYIINPLEVTITDIREKTFTEYAINDVSLLRSTHQTAHIGVDINNITRIQTLIADGLLVATPVGSTSYNLSLNGTIIPIACRSLSLKPISTFSPRFWQGAILPYNTKFRFNVNDPTERRVNLTTDFIEYKNIKKAEIHIDGKLKIRLLFNKNSNIEEKVIKEQFLQNYYK